MNIFKVFLRSRPDGSSEEEPGGGAVGSPGRDGQYPRLSFYAVQILRRQCCLAGIGNTQTLCYLGAETDDHHRNPNINTETIWLGN